MIYLVMMALLRSSYQSDEFKCSTDETFVNSPPDPFQRESKIFGRRCWCDEGWKNEFCSNYKNYLSSKPSAAPNVCICRQIPYKNKSCHQFMTRCFRDAGKNSCRCCFHQPEQYCTQLDCKHMAPVFGNDTSCVCHEQTNYPHEICSAEDHAKSWKPKVPIQPPDFRSVGSSKTGSIPKKDKEPPVPWYEKLYKAVKNNKIVFVFTALFVMGIIVAVCFGLFIICMGRAKTSRTTRRKQKERLETEIKLLEIANNQDTDQYLP